MKSSPYTNPETEPRCASHNRCSLTETIDQLIEDFEMFDDWSERYQYLLELGDELPEMPDALKTEDCRVDGCMSNVWMVARTVGEPAVIVITADSDAQIVRGLIALLMKIYNGRTPREILSCDIHCLFERLQLGKHLSGTRQNGFRAMVRRIQTLAAAAA